MGDERGQASLELLAGVPALLVAGLICLQLLATGYSSTLADGAAESGALALAAGRPPEPAIRASLPGWAEGLIETEVSGSRLTVSLRPPSPVPALGRALEVRSRVWVREPEGS
jgi:hypothetical protein